MSNKLTFDTYKLIESEREGRFFEREFVCSHAILSINDQMVNLQSKCKIKINVDLYGG